MSTNLKYNIMPGKHYGKKKAKMGYMKQGGQALFDALKKKGYKKQGGKMSYMKAGGPVEQFD